MRPHESIRIRHCDDDALVAVVIRAIDRLRDATDRVLFRDYSAEGFAPAEWLPSLDAARSVRGLRFRETTEASPARDRTAADDPRGILLAASALEGSTAIIHRTPGVLLRVCRRLAPIRSVQGATCVVTRTDYDNQLHCDWTERNVRSEKPTNPLATDLDKSDEITLGGAPGHRHGHNSDTIVPVVPQCKGSFEWRSKEPSS